MSETKEKIKSVLKEMGFKHKGVGFYTSPELGSIQTHENDDLLEVAILLIELGKRKKQREIKNILGIVD